jgi:hypothetical protein
MVYPDIIRAKTTHQFTEQTTSHLTSPTRKPNTNHPSTMSSSLSLKRSNSSSSAQSEASNNQMTRNNTNESGSIKRRSSDNKGQGTFLQCGRHSNQWLFNDMSLMDMARSVFGRKD